MKIAFGHHIFERIISEQMYLKEHPDYFPVINGRRGEAPQFSWSLRNKEVLDEVVFVLTQFLRKHPEIDMFDFWPGDGQYKLTEQEYTAVTGEPYQHGAWEKQVFVARTIHGRMGDPNKAKLYARMIKPVAEALGNRFPNLKISTLHYFDMPTCPEETLPANVVPVVALYWRCIKHGTLDKACVYNRQFGQILTEWAQRQPDSEICLYEYYMGMGSHAGLPYPCLTSLFKEWEEMIKLGISGAHVQSGDYQAVPFNLNYLAFAALAWDNPPTQANFLRDYCRGFYGSAGRWVEAMYRLWEEGAQEAKDTQPGVAFFGLMFTRRRVAQCRLLLKKALGATHDPKAIYRISRLLILMEYAREILAIAPWHLKVAMDFRRSKDTDALERKIAPKLEPIVRFVRRLAELGQDIIGTSSRSALPFKDRLLAGDIVARTERNTWEGTLRQIMKKDWARQVFDDDGATRKPARR